MKLTVTLENNTLSYENSAIEQASEMGFAFSDGELEYCRAQDWRDFIGTAFHLIQQTGGVLMLNGQQINAACLEATNGRPVTVDTVVVLNDGRLVALSELLV